MSDFNVPEDIIIDILSRLPVKSLLRFKSVSKSWLALITNSGFIKIHHNRAILNPDNQSLIVHSFQCKSPNHILSLLSLTSLHNPINLNHPFPNFTTPSELDVVGSCNGLVCLSNPPNVVVLWNPATKEVRDISNHYLKVVDMTGEVSLGIGFDPKTSDMKVVRIVCLSRAKNVPIQTQVYSVNADSWREIKVDLQFHMSQLNCCAIVKGTPYWLAMEERWDPREMFLVSFDVHGDVFRKIPLPKKWERIVNYEGSVAVIVNSWGRDENRGIWTMDDECGEKSSWSKKLSTVGLTPRKRRLVGCFKNGEIVAENNEKELILYDLKNEETKNLHFPVEARTFGVYNYTESLFPI